MAIVYFSNRYADQCLSKDGVSYRTSKWHATTAEEIQNFLALTMLMGINGRPCIGNFWSTNKLLAAPIFPSVMSRNRYQLIHKFLHFSDNSQSDSRDRLHKV